VLFLMQNKEHAGSTQPLSNEAVQNIAKVYADTKGTATFNNIKTNGDANFNNIKNTGDATFNGIKNTGTLTTNGEATFNSVTNLKGGGKGDMGGTHFPYWDGTNFIRGPTQIDGDTTINGDLYYTKLKGKGEEQRPGTHGLDGNVGGQYTLKCPEGTVMIGIHGWASGVINKIGPICK
jgi:hypothetical protein